MPGRNRGRLNSSCGGGGCNEGGFGVRASPVSSTHTVHYDTGAGGNSGLAADEWPSLPAQEATTRLANLSLVKYEDKKASYLPNPSEMVTFLIGKDRKKFLVHKDKACTHSEVLRIAFNSTFIEGTTGIYTLEDTNVETFELFTEYLYSQKITLRFHNRDPDDDKDDINEEDHPTKCGDQDNILVSLWVLTEKLMVYDLQNQIIEHMENVRNMCGTMRSDAFHFVYENTEKGSPLRSYVAEQATWCSADGVYAEDSNAHPHEMLIDMVTCFRAAAPSYVRNKRANAIDGKDYYVYKPNSS
ncbi:hypothetical protein BDZ45DRAFT_682475 [Acephala macrosclerotiorum]|nr:hypothetical protein BDZ45DRAFT_682475 [Acephala macrosclerotiorum]